MIRFYILRNTVFFFIGKYNKLFTRFITVIFIWLIKKCFILYINNIDFYYKYNIKKVILFFTIYCFLYIIIFKIDLIRGNINKKKKIKSKILQKIALLLFNDYIYFITSLYYNYIVIKIRFCTLYI